MRLLFSGLLLLTACTPALPIVTDGDRAWARRAFPETQDDLDESRWLYAQKCSGCHLLVLPHKVPQGEWPRVVDKMAPKAHLTESEQVQILRYVLTASRPDKALAQ